MTVTKPRRLELRTDDATEQLMADAAQLLHVSKSAFVTEAARRAAEQVRAAATSP
jgi:uncharacterized protein (DUF1778 family)